VPTFGRAAGHSIRLKQDVLTWDFLTLKPRPLFEMSGAITRSRRQDLVREDRIDELNISNRRREYGVSCGTLASLVLTGWAMTAVATAASTRLAAIAVKFG
jgi:hypothetical protein